MMTTKKLYLLDAHALCYRSFYAVKGLVNSKGQPTNAVFGFVNALRKIMKDFAPEYFAVCFDKEGKKFRQDHYAEYKIQRKPMPDDLISQMGLIRDIVDAYRLGVMEIAGYEADDLIATTTGIFKDQDVKIVIISDDKDLFQLVDDRVRVYSPRKNELLDQAGVEQVLGVPPVYVSDLLGLAGDASDNIPGVQGIGKVTAQKLIRQFGSMEDIYASLENITSKSVREKLAAQKDQAFLSRDLARLRMDADVSAELDDWKIRDADIKKLFDLFTELEFPRFIADLPASGMDVSMDSGSAIVSWDKVEKGILKNRRMAFFHAADGVVYVTDGAETACLDASALQQMKMVFDNPGILKITYDVKQQYKALWPRGLDCGDNVFDVMLAGYLLNPARNGHTLPALCSKYLERMLGSDAGPCQEISALFQLFPPLTAAMTDRECGALFQDVEMPLARVLAQMEDAGVRIDLVLLNQLSGECLKKMNALEQEIYALAGEEFNIHSPKQLSSVLFEKLRLPVVKKNKTGFSTNEEVLHKLASRHPLPGKILDYRQLAKLKSTYIDALPELAHQPSGSPDGRGLIHTSFNQTVAETGRLSSSNPNLQNIPVRTELGRQIRRAFIASEDGHLLLAADYSQIELRILAHLSGDEHLVEAFHAGEDIHTFTAGLIFDVKAEDVLPEMRVAAKRVNFGIIYGISAFGLAKDMGIPNAQAQDFIDRYFFRYPKVKSFMEKAVEDCRQHGYAVTLMNRRRDIPEIYSRNAAIRQFAERQAINTPVQGSAADLIKLSMVRIQQRLQRQELRSRMLITVHDEIIFDMVPAEESQLVDLAVSEMEGAMQLHVPIRVSVKKGKNWLEMEKIL